MHKYYLNKFNKGYVGCVSIITKESQTRDLNKNRLIHYYCNNYNDYSIYQFVGVDWPHHRVAQTKVSRPFELTAVEDNTQKLFH